MKKDMSKNNINIQDNIYLDWLHLQQLLQKYNLNDLNQLDIALKRKNHLIQMNLNFIGKEKQIKELISRYEIKKKIEPIGLIDQIKLLLES